MIAGGVELDIAVLLMRLLLGLTMAAHGWNKFFGTGGIQARAAWFESIGMKPGLFTARAAASVEVAAGLALALGAFTPLAAAGFVAVMLVAIRTVSGRNGFFITANGYEYNLVLAATPVLLAMIGPGRFSIDQLLFADTPIAPVFSGWWAFAIAAGLGLIGGLGQLAVFYRPAPKADASAG